MDEDVFNMSVRKFLKKLGVTAQREIEAAVRDAVASRRLTGKETIKARAVVTVEGTSLRLEVDSDIALA